MQSVYFFSAHSLAMLASIRTEEIQEALHERDTEYRHTAPVFVDDTTSLLLQPFHGLPGEKELDCVARKASKGKFLSLIVCS